MKQLGSRGMKTLWIIHIIGGGVWMGIGVSMLTLILMARSASPNSVYGIFEAILRLDHVAAGTAGSVFLMGLVFGIWTPWGFFKHRWIFLKWVFLVVKTQVLGYMVMMPPLLDNLSMLGKSATSVSDPRFAKNIHVLTLAIVVQVALLFFTVVISRLKPWRKRPIE